MQIAPILVYNFFDGRAAGFSMYVPEEDFISYSFFAGLFLVFGFDKLPIKAKSLYIQKTKENGIIGVYLILAGFLGSAFDMMKVPGLGFVFYIAASLKFIGTYYLIFSKHKHKVLLISIVYVFFLVSKIIIGGVFYELISWSLFLIIFIAYDKKFRFKKNILLFFSGIFILFILQTVKTEFRQYLKKNEDVDKIALFSEILFSKTDNSETLFNENASSGFIGRLNTAWVVTKIMDHIPREENFSNGKKLAVDILSAFIPRFLYPEKREISGEKYKEYFFKYTGFQLIGYTTVSLSLLGDMYINFGTIGGIIALFFIGKLLNLFYKKIYIRGGQYILWLPLFFFDAIRMNELFVTLNSLIKIIIFFYLVKLFFTRIGLKIV